MRRRGRPPHPDILTPREWEVLALLRDGLSNEEIAARLGISPSTAKFHVSEILGKLRVNSRDEAARWQPDRVARRGFLLAPLATLRRLRLGWPLQLAGGVLIVAVVAGIGGLAWGVTASRGHGDSGPRAVVAPTTPLACATPAYASTSGVPLELGTSPIFWRFGGLTEQDLASGQYCGRNFKIVLRVTNGADRCGPQQMQAGNVATGEHLAIPLTCAQPTGTDLPGAYFVTSFELPSAGEWRLQVRFLQDFSSQTVRIGGADVPAAELGPQPPCAPPQQPGGGTPMAVVLVQRATGECKVIPTADRLMQAKWVEDGKTFVAYDTDENAFVIYDVDGTPLQAIDLKVPNPPPPNGPIYGTVSAAPDGKTLFVERNAPGIPTPLVIRVVASGQDQSFPQPDGVNGQASFSPDGLHAAYINTNAGRQSLVMAGLPLTNGRYSVVRSVDASTDYITPLQWSPDGKYLLLMTGKHGPVGQGVSTEVFEVIPADGGATADPVWSSGDVLENRARLTFAEWAGSNRVLIREPSVKASDGTPLPAAAHFVSIPNGQETVLDAVYAGMDSVSPDGTAATSGGSLIELPSLRMTRTAEFDATYQVDWTADGSEVLLSFQGV